MSDITVQVSVYSSGVGARPAPHDRATKAEANYKIVQPTNPNYDPEVRCGTCEHFRMTRCEIVAGRIESDHVCDWWEKEVPV